MSNDVKPPASAEDPDAGLAIAGDAAPEPDAGEPADPELAAARREAEEQRDAALRARAELENLRRRSERDVENAHRYALERFVAELLPVRDSLELGLVAASGDDVDAGRIREGIELTLKMFGQAIEKFGVAEVDPVGLPFDPEFHQAMTVQDSAEAEPGTVIGVVQKGYVLNDRLVRPAMVIVAK